MPTAGRQRPKTPFELQRRNRPVPQSLPRAWCPKKGNGVNRTGSLQRNGSMDTVLEGRAGACPARNDTERGTPARRGAVTQHSRAAGFSQANERPERGDSEHRPSTRNQRWARSSRRAASIRRARNLEIGHQRQNAQHRRRVPGFAAVGVEHLSDAKPPVRIWRTRAGYGDGLDGQQQRLDIEAPIIGLTTLAVWSLPDTGAQRTGWPRTLAAQACVWSLGHDRIPRGFVQNAAS